MKRNTIIISAIVVVAFGAIAWTLVSNKKTVDSKREMKAVNTEIAVTVVPSEMRTLNGLLNLVGTAEANHAVTVASELTGSITQVNFKLGDYVSKGTVLAQIDDAYKRLALDNATINYDKYKEDYERYQVLRKGDAVSETQLRDMKVAYENASIQLENAKKTIERYPDCCSVQRLYYIAEYRIGRSC
ncbi:MAG: Multidrug resistance protein MdtA [Candidatus Ordinivivax streblomastigis]|uniref:Multidrug resistance protein MdtA n=1 Tax=Candidatus Ordinivivax streblomastigis TaxID=2540710 RepID=A0A5M8NZR1_9BACT|nr:MAG: Multidrug resistance protein MdtA [Candidatus Ordinivivax streblomastigis]